MSGFFGILRPDGKMVEEQFLAKIAKELHFRGPDGTSVWTEDGLGGCFTRMETGPAKQAERQPVSLGERFWLWGDMRLDDREELQRQLADGGSAPSTDASSEEIFLRAWQKWGEHALEKVIGDFSLALWDAAERTLWCARDFVGTRPLYYAHKGGVFCFSNTLDILLRVPEISDELDEGFIGDFLLEGWSREASRSVYRDIRRVPAGHVLKFSDGEIAVRRFRKLPIEEPLRLKRAEEYVERYLELLQVAVKDRLPEREAAIYLSGGLDSGSVAAVATQIAGERGQKEKLKALTVSWQPLLDDPEPTFAECTAKHLGLAWEVFQEPEFAPFEGAEKMETSPPEPGEDFFFAREQRQNRRIASHANVVLIGYGGDDIQVGQSWPYLVQLWRNKDWGRIAWEYGGFFLRHGFFPPLRGGFRSKISRLIRIENSLQNYPRWLNEEFEARANLKQRWLELRHQEVNQEHPVHPRAYERFQSGSWAEFMEATDAGWTHVRVETRAPLLDLRILEFQFRLPPVPWCVNKELARKAMRHKLPVAIVNRPKTPLVKDPAEECLESKVRASLLPGESTERVRKFVKWEKWCETFAGPKGSLTLKDFRPLNLLYWLKAIEMKKWIQ